MAWARSSAPDCAHFSSTPDPMKALALKEYRAAIAALGRERRTSVLREALRLAYFRLYSGKGAALYVSHGLADVPPSAWNEYLDKREMCVLQKKVNDPTDFPALDDKLLFDERCRKHGVPAPEIEAVIGSATIGPPGYNYLKSSADLARFALNRSGRDFVVKIRNGTYGIGLRAIRCTSEGIVDLATGEGTTPDRFFAELDVARSDYLVQPRLVRCNELRDVMPGLALGTVRIITFIQRDGTVLVPYALIKLPITGPVADNFVHGQSGNLISGIDVASGTMINAFGRPRG